MSMAAQAISTAAQAMLMSMAAQLMTHQQTIRQETTL